MKYLKSFENIKSIKDIKNEIEYIYIQRFKNQEQLNNFLMDLAATPDGHIQPNNDDIGFEDWEDELDKEEEKLTKEFALELGIENKYSISERELANIIMEIVTEVDLNNCQNMREITYEDFLIKKNSEKYNL